MLTVRQCLDTLSERESATLLGMLLLGDVFFVVLHCVNSLESGFRDPFLAITYDRAYAESFQYLKYYWLAAIFVFAARKLKAKRYLVWTIVFTYLLADDSLHMHEQLGRTISTWFESKAIMGLGPQEMGELTVSGTAGSALLLIVGLAYLRATSQFKLTSRSIALLILPLAFFGVLVDMLHQATELGHHFSFAYGLVEDGGEMISASFLTWYATQSIVRHLLGHESSSRDIEPLESLN